MQILEIKIVNLQFKWCFFNSYFFVKLYCHSVALPFEKDACSAAEFGSNEVLYARRPTACWVHDVLKCCLCRQLTMIWNRASVCRCHRSSIHTIRLDSSTFHTYTLSLSLSLSLSLNSCIYHAGLLNTSTQTQCSVSLCGTWELLISHCLSCLRNTRALFLYVVFLRALKEHVAALQRTQENGGSLFCCQACRQWP